MFLAPDTEFSMDVVSGLESEAISYIREHGLIHEVENSNVPNPYINPYNMSFIRSLHEDILSVWPLLGYDLDAVGDDYREAMDHLFHTTRRGIRAIGRYNAEEGSLRRPAWFARRPIDSCRHAKETERKNRDNSRPVSSSGRLAATRGQLVRTWPWRLASAARAPQPSSSSGQLQIGWTEWVDEVGRLRQRCIGRRLRASGHWAHHWPKPRLWSRSRCPRPFWIWP